VLALMTMSFTPVGGRCSLRVRSTLIARMEA
jgi:hypothetical protein